MFLFCSYWPAGVKGAESEAEITAKQEGFGSRLECRLEQAKRDAPGICVEACDHSARIKASHQECTSGPRI